VRAAPLCESRPSIVDDGDIGDAGPLQLGREQRRPQVQHQHDDHADLALLQAPSDDANPVPNGRRGPDDAGGRAKRIDGQEPIAEPDMIGEELVLVMISTDGGRGPAERRLRQIESEPQQGAAPPPIRRRRWVVPDDQNGTRAVQLERAVFPGLASVLYSQTFAALFIDRMANFAARAALSSATRRASKPGVAPAFQAISSRAATCRRFSIASSAVIGSDRSGRPAAQAGSVSASTWMNKSRSMLPPV
jgi:hypothetical protein